MTSWTFTFEGKRGRAIREGRVCWISWGGMGFHFEAATDALQRAILLAEPLRPAPEKQGAQA